MKIPLAYGRHGLQVEIPDDATVLLPKQNPGLPSEAQALYRALEQPLSAPPLREMVSSQDTVAIVFSDLTRPMPTARVLPPLLEHLSHVPDDQILLINALGTHRCNTPNELAEILGEPVLSRYPILQHDAWDEENLVRLGTSSFGHPILVNRPYCEADVRILTGLIEPHLFAGFSGGPKAVLPGIAGFRTIMQNHGYEMLAHPKATYGYNEGNPMWEEIREAARMAKPHMILNVSVNRKREITGVFAGEMEAAHAAGVQAVRESAMVPVDQRYDIVITTNSGFPLDLNLYQGGKGMRAALPVLKRGGTLIYVAECQDGIPEHGEYREIVHQAGSAQGILDLLQQPGFQAHDQWQAQVHAGVLLHAAEVHVYSENLSDEEITGMLCVPCRSVEDTIAALKERYGPEARICVLPEGPQTIPYLDASA